MLCIERFKNIVQARQQLQKLGRRHHLRAMPTENFGSENSSRVSKQSGGLRNGEFHRCCSLREGLCIAQNED